MSDFFDGAPRTGLGATLSGLKAGRRRADPSAYSSDLRLQHRAFGPNPGGLEMWTYVPEGLKAGAALVVVLHGCTQTAEAFANDSGWVALADRLGLAVLAPQQVASNNPDRCFNWFQAEDLRRGAGEPASIAAMIQAAVRAHGLDADRVFITGLSAGGAMTAVMLAAYPELFAGGAIIAGAPYGTAQGVAQAFQTMQGRSAMEPTDLAALLKQAGGGAPLPPLCIWHGEADYVVNRANGVEIARQWAAGQGLSLVPDAVVDHAGYVRSVWRDADGAPRIQLNQVAGLGHGVPLETRGDGAVGRTAPFMLQAGVSSTLEIARFWGLTAKGHVTALEGELLDDDADVGPLAHGSSSTLSGGLGEQVMSAVSGVPANVQAIIADALAKGGLLKRRS